MLFIVIEALVGASLVLFKWVAHDESLGRIIAIPIHLANTFLLLASLALTAWWASGGKRLGLRARAQRSGPGNRLVGVLILGMSGAVTALGDTLFPAESLGEAFRLDFTETAPFLIRLRVLHPAIAITVGFYLLFIAGLLAMFRPTPQVRRPALALAVLFVCQLAAGLVNVLACAGVDAARAPAAGRLVWITLVLLGGDPGQEGRVFPICCRADCQSALQ
jgi:heme A synthase